MDFEEQIWKLVLPSNNKARSARWMLRQLNTERLGCCLVAQLTHTSHPNAVTDVAAVFGAHIVTPSDYDFNYLLNRI